MILLVIRIPARLVSFLVEHFEWCLLLAALFVIAGVHTLGVQGNTFKDCKFQGNGLNDGLVSTYCFTMCRRGGSSGQGSENLFLNCHFSFSTTACYYQDGYNALNNTFIGGNFQSYFTHGIYIIAGSVQVFSVGFQSTLGYTQIINDGYDINANSGGTGDAIAVYGCRTESMRFYRGGFSQAADIGCLTFTPNTRVWTSSTAYGLNEVVYEGGLFYRVTTAGISGLTEPTWPSSGTVADGSVVWTQTPVLTIDLPTGQFSYRTSPTVPGSLVAAKTPQYDTVTEVQADYTITKDDASLLVDTTSGPVTVTLTPSLSYVPNGGQRITVKRYNTDANPVIITPVLTAAGNVSVTLPGGTQDSATFVRIGSGALTGGFYQVDYYSSQYGGVFQTKAGDPTASDIALGRWALYKNTSSGVLSVWANDGGVMKSVALT